MNIQEIKDKIKKQRDQVYIKMNQICLNSQCKKKKKNAPLHGDINK